MKQKYLVIVLLGLIIASGATSFQSYKATEKLIENDMSQALASALKEQHSNTISADTIRVFNSYLQIEELRGRAMLAVDTRQKVFKCEAKCSVATILAMSDQKPATILWMATIAWAAFCIYRRKQAIPLLAGVTHYGGLNYIESERRRKAKLLWSPGRKHVRKQNVKQAGSAVPREQAGWVGEKAPALSAGLAAWQGPRRSSLRPPRPC